MRRRHSYAGSRAPYILPSPQRQLVATLPPRNDLARRCRDTCRQAAAARDRSQTVLASLRAGRAERLAWAALFQALRHSDDVLVACCAYCFRLRLPDGAWRVPPAPLRQMLVDRQRLTHTYCEDCIHLRHFD